MQQCWLGVSSRALAASLMLAAALTVLGPGAASAATCGNGAGQPVQPGSSDILGGVAITSCRVWAVGDYIVAGNVRTLVERWNGTAWTLVPSPSPASSYNILSGVAAASASDAWAVGQSSGNPAGHVFQTLAEHWNGTAWTQATTPNPGTGNNYLASVAATSASGAWAVGGYDTGPGTALHALAVHWNGTAWTQAPIPNPGAGTPTYNYLNAVAATSASDAWAVGSYSASAGGSLTLIDHWNGTAWTHVPSPSPGSPTTCPAWLPSPPPTPGRWAATPPAATTSTPWSSTGTGPRGRRCPSPAPTESRSLAGSRPPPPPTSG